jgi:rod shape-determining protein MreC
MLITDVDHAIPVELVRNRLRTIAVGTGELNRLSLPYLPVSADIRDGDVFITSGLGGKFPPGYPVGTVRSVRSVPGLPFLEVDAEPAAALNRIREVLLITPPKPEEISGFDNAFPTDDDTPENSGTAPTTDAASQAPPEANASGTPVATAPGNAASAVTTAAPSTPGTPATAGAERPAGDTLENTGAQPPAASSNATMPVEDTE